MLHRSMGIKDQVTTTNIARNIGPIVIPEGCRMGPAMRRLSNDNMRRFVIAMLESPTVDYKGCAARAGYTGMDDSLSSTGSRLAHDERVLAAIQEEAKARMGSGAIYAVTALIDILRTGAFPDGQKVPSAIRWQSVLALLNRVGLHAMMEMKQTHTIEIDESDLVKKITALSGQLGIDPKKLLGTAGIIDAEYTEVKQIAISDDISDIL